MQADAVDKQVNPPMKGSTRLKKEGTIPKGGRVMWLSDPNSAATLDRIYNFIFDVDHATQLRDKIAESIKDAYYVNAFQRFISTNRSYLTAKQVGQEEKEILTELSPVLELLNYDVLSPLWILCSRRWPPQMYCLRPPKNYKIKYWILNMFRPSTKRRD